MIWNSIVHNFLVHAIFSLSDFKLVDLILIDEFVSIWDHPKKWSLKQGKRELTWSHTNKKVSTNIIKINKRSPSRFLFCCIYQICQIIVKQVKSVDLCRTRNYLNHWNSFASPKDLALHQPYPLTQSLHGVF